MSGQTVYLPPWTLQLLWSALSLAAAYVVGQVAKIIVTVLGLLMILNGLGVSIAPLLTALGVGGLAVALALQDTLANLFSGLYLTMARYVRVGDYVRLETGQEGYVEDIGWRATKIRMLSGNRVFVPNQKLGQAIITLLSAEPRTGPAG